LTVSDRANAALEATQESVGKQFLQDHISDLSEPSAHRRREVAMAALEIAQERKPREAALILTPVRSGRAAAATVLQTGLDKIKEAEEAFIRGAGGMQAVVDAAIESRFHGYSDKYPGVARKFEPIKELMEGPAKEIAGKRVGVMSKKTLKGVLGALRAAAAVAARGKKGLTASDIGEGLLGEIL